MFLDNKYTVLYYKLVTNTTGRDKFKGCHRHHIIPRSLGGSNLPENLVHLTYKEHRLCHLLLTKMIDGIDQWKMKHAYKLFDKRYDLTGSPWVGWSKAKHEKGVNTRKRNGSYPRGKNNIFSTDPIKQIVKQRMISNNPMKDINQRNRMSKNNPNPYQFEIVTPIGTFNSKTKAVKALGLPYIQALNKLMIEQPELYYQPHAKLSILP